MQKTNKGMKVNINKIKVEWKGNGERQKAMQKAARWLCSACSRGVGSNLI